MKLPKNRSVQKSLSIIWQNLFFWGSMLIFSLRYPRNKFLITFLSALVCPDTRLQPPNPPTSNQLAITTAPCGLMGWRFKTWQINPKNYIDNVWQNGLSQKITSQRRASSVTKNVGIIQKKRRHFTISPIKRTLEKHRDTYKSWFFLAVLVKNHSFSFRSSVWLPHDLTAIPLPCCLTTLHTLV